MGSKPEYCLALRLETDKIRSIVPDPIQPMIKPLDVVWHPLFQNNGTGQSSPDPRPGASGHTGTSGLKDGSVPNKIQRKSLRSQLADMAEVMDL